MAVVHSQNSGNAIDLSLVQLELLKTVNWFNFAPIDTRQIQFEHINFANELWELIFHSHCAKWCETIGTEINTYTTIGRSLAISCARFFQSLLSQFVLQVFKFIRISRGLIRHFLLATITRNVGQEKKYQEQKNTHTEEQSSHVRLFHGCFALLFSFIQNSNILFDSRSVASKTNQNRRSVLVSSMFVFEIPLQIAFEESEESRFLCVILIRILMHVRDCIECDKMCLWLRVRFERRNFLKLTLRTLADGTEHSCFFFSFFFSASHCRRSLVVVVLVVCCPVFIVFPHVIFADFFLLFLEFLRSFDRISSHSFWFCLVRHRFRLQTDRMSVLSCALLLIDNKFINFIAECDRQRTMSMNFGHKFASMASPKWRKCFVNLHLVCGYFRLSREQIFINSIKSFEEEEKWNHNEKILLFIWIYRDEEFHCLFDVYWCVAAGTDSNNDDSKQNSKIVDNCKIEKIVKSIKNWRLLLMIRYAELNELSRRICRNSQFNFKWTQDGRINKMINLEDCDLQSKRNANDRTWFA